MLSLLDRHHQFSHRPDCLQPKIDSPLSLHSGQPPRSWNLGSDEVTDVCTGTLSIPAGLMLASGLGSHGNIAVSTVDLGLGNMLKTTTNLSVDHKTNMIN